MSNETDRINASGYSDPDVQDSDRCGLDLILRMRELSDPERHPEAATPGNGWRRLLAAAVRELERQRDLVLALSEKLAVCSEELGRYAELDRLNAALAERVAG